MAVVGTIALLHMAIRQHTSQFNGNGLRPQELWLLGLIFAITFEAITNFFRPETVGGKLSVWTLTLMGCSCLFGGFALGQIAIVALGSFIIMAGYAMAVFQPNPPLSRPPPQADASDNAAR
jgi:hypothetical protein